MLSEERYRSVAMRHNRTLNLSGLIFMVLRVETTLLVNSWVDAAYQKILQPRQETKIVTRASIESMSSDPE